MDLKTNTELQGGKYQIEQTLSQGGFGITYLATHTILKRRVAIKEFFMKEYCDRSTDSHVSMGTVGSREMVERFRNKFIKEAQTIATLEHNNIIRIFDIFEENGTAYYVMEYHEGGSIAEYLKMHKTMPEGEALRLVKQVADALDYLHKRSMNHLDIKPANILLSSQNNAVLIDFGLSKAYDEKGNQTSTTPVGISHGYAPLEQYRAGGVGSFSPQTDIYSLGATLYKMLTGATPPEAVAISVDGLPILPSEISTATQNAITKAMSPMRGDRPANIAAFLELLNGAPQGGEELHNPTHNKISQNTDSEETVITVNDDENAETKIIDKIEELEKTTPNVEQQPISNPKNNSSRRLVIVILSVLLGIAIGVGILFLLNKESKQDSPNEAGTIAIDSNLTAEELYQLASEALDEDEYERAFELFYKSAEMGSVESQAAIGLCYYYGLGLDEVDYYEAFRWLSKAEAQGVEDSDVYFYLGRCYYFGYGVDEDDDKAFECFTKAAELGDCSEAGELYGLLAQSYYDGYGVTVDYDQAVKWARRGVAEEDALSQLYLGKCYYYGNGVSENNDEAVRYFRLAADQDLVQAHYFLGLCYYYGHGVSENNDEAVRHFRIAANEGLSSAQYFLGTCYQYGYGVTKDIDTAVEWFRSAAEQGHSSAQDKLEELGYDY